MVAPGSHITLTDTPDCIRALCEQANAAVGCHLRYKGQLPDGRFEIVANDTPPYSSATPSGWLT